MARLHRKLQETAAGARVLLLSDDQVLVSRNMVPNPGDKGKAATYVPGTGGYEVYVSCRSAEADEAMAAASQRMTGPAGPVTPLRIDPPGTSGQWRLRTSGGEVVRVHATAGSSAMCDEVNVILSEVEAVLLS
ncbi:hypothetical protein [Amycolatopsis sp. NPDC051128]|uniref:hypothetical protein n=1 Tax=Amycolatopsis sp. NPDC051128 TaxID=3155412 RepID=UPI00344987ED